MSESKELQVLQRVLSAGLLFAQPKFLEAKGSCKANPYLMRTADNSYAMIMTDCQAQASPAKTTLPLSNWLRYMMHVRRESDDM